MKAILASSLGGQIKVDGKRIPTKLMENNGLLDTIRSCWKADSKVMIISGSPSFYDKNDSVESCMKESFSLSGLSFTEFLMCDERNKEIIARIPEMDVVILAGGHVPSQNVFLKELQVKVLSGKLDDAPFVSLFGDEPHWKGGPSAHCLI